MSAESPQNSPERTAFDSNENARMDKEKTAREAGLAEQAKTDIALSKEQADALLAKMQGGGVEEGGRISKELGNSLKKAHDEMYSPGQTAETQKLIKERWIVITQEIISKLSDLYDCANLYGFIPETDPIFDAYGQKWDALSEQAADSASTVEEIEKAIKTRRPGNPAGQKLYEMLKDKFERLTGKPYPELWRAQSR